MSNSDLHNNDPLPIAVFGHGYGKIKGGQHLHYPQDTPLANLLLTLLQRGGIPVADARQQHRRPRRGLSDGARACASSRRSAQLGLCALLLRRALRVGLAARARRRRSDHAGALERIASGARRRTSAPDGTTALHWAAHHGDLELVEASRAGADLNARNDYGSTPMTEAGVEGDCGILKLLLEAGADASRRTRKGRRR